MDFKHKPFVLVSEKILPLRFLEMVVIAKGFFDFLPQTGDIEKVREKIFEYVDSAIERGGMEVNR